MCGSRGNSFVVGWTSAGVARASPFVKYDLSHMTYIMHRTAWTREGSGESTWTAGGGYRQWLMLVSKE